MAGGEDALLGSGCALGLPPWRSKLRKLRGLAPLLPGSHRAGVAIPGRATSFLTGTPVALRGGWSSVGRAAGGPMLGSALRPRDPARMPRRRAGRLSPLRGDRRPADAPACA